MARRPSASSPQTPTPAPFVGSGVDGAVIGAPSLQGPTPIPLLLGNKAAADVPVPVKPSAQRSLLSKQRDGAAADKARRVLKSTSVPPAARLERDENAHRRSEAVVAGKNPVRLQARLRAQAWREEPDVCALAKHPNQASDNDGDNAAGYNQIIRH
ncbi:hypothetical protein BD414DRAFT_541395 [Trametes punicea]|nr:hypothetical protein BD414DRAFT_541395 [Trametes punicea]